MLNILRLPDMGIMLAEDVSTYALAYSWLQYFRDKYTVCFDPENDELEEFSYVIIREGDKEDVYKMVH